ncbi:MAG: phosphatidate cytidylyltransferase [Deltaproteobacteria bacterium]|nr:phosphatidate cytidylyltransferase [Deltaproteobacteria bacterium]MBW1941357.1 phosphatidate cytidylyltransferase [Deltaproteobacteria bacterium]MBW2205344.1 phosphatidate cytidylyltransferase [Deltaproteobacteria bacterium]
MKGMDTREKKKSAHLRRWLTAIIAVPFLIYIIGFGPRELFHLLLFLAAITGQFEFYRITCPDLSKLVQGAGALLTLWLFLSLSLGQVFILPAIILSWVLVPMTLVMFTYRSVGTQSMHFLANAIMAPLYACLPLSLLILVDKRHDGDLWVFFLLAVIFLGDTGAFYFGRLFGKHKLYPSVSPGKTWEGAIGGLFSSLIAALVFFLFIPLYKWGVAIIGLTAALSIAGQIGDLAESVIKRTYGVKDSGGILPGHGGILDRIDGLLFSIPILYIYLSWSI